MGMPSLLRVGASLAVFQFFSMFCAFGRNVVLARQLSPEDMGVCMLLTMIIATLDQIFESGLTKFIVQHDSDGTDYVSTAQSYGIGRGVLVGTILACLSPTIAYWFAVPFASTSLFALALIPFVRGFVNYGMYEQQKRLNFRAINCADSVGQFFGLIGATVGAWLFGDYRAVLPALFFQAFGSLWVSHFLAPTRFQLKLDVTIVRAIIKFSGPLLFNGVLLALTMNGDRFVIGLSKSINSKAYVSISEFASYSVCFGLVFTLTMGFLRVASNLMLPSLVNLKSNPTQLRAQVFLFAQALCLYASLVTIFFATAGTVIVKLIYGAEYVLKGDQLAWMSIAMSLRALRTLPNTLAMAFGNTWNSLIANVVRSLALPLAVLAIAMDYGIQGVLIVLTGSEVAALGVATQLSARRYTGSGLSRTIATLYAPVAIICLLQSRLSNENLLEVLFVFVLNLSACGALFYVFAPQLTARLRSYSLQIRRRITHK